MLMLQSLHMLTHPLWRRRWPLSQVRLPNALEEESPHVGAGTTGREPASHRTVRFKPTHAHPMVLSCIIADKERTASRHFLTSINQYVLELQFGI